MFEFPLEFFLFFLLLHFLKECSVVYYWYVPFFLFLKFWTEKKPKPQLTRNLNYNKMYPGESVTFTCLVTVSSGWEYEWYHNSSKIQQSSNAVTIRSLDHSDSGEYHCKAKRGQSPFYTEETDTITLQVSGECIFMLSPARIHINRGRIMALCIHLHEPVCTLWMDVLYFVWLMFLFSMT